jgi:hypothetical protein
MLKFCISIKNLKIIIIFPGKLLSFMVKCGIQEVSVEKYKLCSTISVFR